ncbi:MAG: bifunctional diaminohydroxyphosphoribosylaminopyrimidine deaminase/5-amino-6-(5-phosphoribosylamino)uracil reductase RibD [Sedimentisphaerales bacterium]
MTSDQDYMLGALQLAKRGLGQVEPNPVVGAVIVKNGRIIGKGWHKKFGGPHAEINALENCKKRGNNPKGATMFVTLEPCCHYGKTGPCTDALIAAKLKKVVVATIDPSKHANGKGIRQLRKAGIKVDVGLYEEGARVLNAPFMKFARTGKPWVTLKWAQSADGFLARTDKKRWITGSKSRKDAHRLRRRAEAILVGINTVLKDDPLLTPRPGRGKKPIRIVLDEHLRIPLDRQLLATAKNVPVLVVTQDKMLRTKKAKQIISRGAELLACPKKSKSNLQFLLRYLGKRVIGHLLVEGGPTVIGSFLKENLADGIVVYISPKVLEKRGAADIDISPIDNYTQMRYVNMKRIGDDIKISGLTSEGLKAAGIHRNRL